MFTSLHVCSQDRSDVNYWLAREKQKILIFLGGLYGGTGLLEVIGKQSN